MLEPRATLVVACALAMATAEGVVSYPDSAEGSAADYPVTLTRATFPLFVTVDGLALVEFRHGGEPAPDFADAAWLLRDIMPLCQVDVRTDPRLASVHNLSLSALPARYMFRRGVPMRFAATGVQQLVAGCMDAVDVHVEEDVGEAAAAQLHTGGGRAWLHRDGATADATRGSPSDPPKSLRLRSVAELVQLQHAEEVPTLTF